MVNLIICCPFFRHDGDSEDSEDEDIIQHVGNGDVGAIQHTYTLTDDVELPYTNGTNGLEKVVVLMRNGSFSQATKEKEAIDKENHTESADGTMTTTERNVPQPNIVPQSPPRENAAEVQLEGGDEHTEGGLPPVAAVELPVIAVGVKVEVEADSVTVPLLPQDIEERTAAVITDGEGGTMGQGIGGGIPLIRTSLPLDDEFLNSPLGVAIIADKEDEEEQVEQQQQQHHHHQQQQSRPARPPTPIIVLTPRARDKTRKKGVSFKGLDVDDDDSKAMQQMIAQETAEEAERREKDLEEREQREREEAIKRLEEKKQKMKRERRERKDRERKEHDERKQRERGAAEQQQQPLAPPLFQEEADRQVQGTEDVVLRRVQKMADQVAVAAVVVVEKAVEGGDVMMDEEEDDATSSEMKRPGDGLQVGGGEGERKETEEEAEKRRRRERREKKRAKKAKEDAEAAATLAAAVKAAAAAQLAAEEAAGKATAAEAAAAAIVAAATSKAAEQEAQITHDDVMYEKACSMLKGGVSVMKHGRNSSTVVRVLSSKDNLVTIGWGSGKSFVMSECMECRRGSDPDPSQPGSTGTVILRKGTASSGPDSLSRSFSLIFAKRSVDVTCPSLEVADSLITGIRAALKRNGS